MDMQAGAVEHHEDRTSPQAHPALPRVSVALCVYNGARYLPAQLDSLLAQEDVDLDIVAIDDQSTDGSLPLLLSYARRDPRIRVHANFSNQGHLRSFVNCMALCKADLIAPCDQDDVWHPRKLATLVKAIGDADLAYCDSAYIDQEGRPLGRRISEDLHAMHSGHDLLKYAFQNTVSGHAMLVRRSVFDAALPFPAQLYHDWWLAIRAAAGKGVAYVDEPLVQFRRHVQACSPLGKDADSAMDGERARGHALAHATRNRKWLEQLMYVMGAIADTNWPQAARAREWNRALQAAQGDDFAPVRRLAWRDRASVPPWKGPMWLRAVRCFVRCRRKVRRARGEPALSTPLFSG